MLLPVEAEGLLGDAGEDAGAQGMFDNDTITAIRHDADTLSVYAHNRTLLAKEGQAVRRGQKIAELGDSGTDSPKLHFEIRKSGRPVDPLKLLPPR